MSLNEPRDDPVEDIALTREVLALLAILGLAGLVVLLLQRI